MSLVIPIQKQIETANRMIGDLKTVLSMVRGDSEAEHFAVRELNQMIAVRETLKAVERQDAEYLNAINKLGNGVVPRPRKHQVSHVQ